MSALNPTTDPVPAGLSRRGLFGALPAVAALGLGVAVLDAAPASAAAGDPVVMGSYNDAGGTITSLTSTNAQAILQLVSPDVRLQTNMTGGFIELTDNDGTDGGLSFELTADFSHGTGSAYINGSAAMVEANGFVHGSAGGFFGSPAVAATSTGAPAVIARAASGFVGPTEMPTTAIDAASTLNGTGLQTASDSGAALLASNTNASTTTDAATITTAGLGRALLAHSLSRGTAQPTVTAVNEGSGAAVQGIQNNPKAVGPAVVGQAGLRGRGAVFSGGAAAVRMLPAAAATHPPTGLLGDFYVDASTRLWFCKGGSAWHQLA